MTLPDGFSWIDKPLLAAMARPSDPDQFVWLRQQGIELLVSLSEDPPRRDWAENASLLVFHDPIPDMEAPSQDQLDRIVSAIGRAHERNMGVAVHCYAGHGRTGTVLAAYLVSKGESSTQAIARVRQLRPGSIETADQEEAIHFFGRRRRRTGDESM
jgi:atypical dual specificity phosphatase